MVVVGTCHGSLEDLRTIQLKDTIEMVSTSSN